MDTVSTLVAGLRVTLKETQHALYDAFAQLEAIATLLERDPLKAKIQVRKTKKTTK